MNKRLVSCVQPGGSFLYGIHKPEYKVRNLRTKKNLARLGKDKGKEINNSVNYPDGDVEIEEADWIYEIPNPFPFRGRTFIDKEWADASAKDIKKIRLPQQPEVSLTETLQHIPEYKHLITILPPPLQLALATTTTDSRDLLLLAKASCEFLEEEGQPVQLKYITIKGSPRPIIHNHQLFEAVANNPSLPDDYKIAMVIRPGVQGASEIVGAWRGRKKSHIYEYLRKNSYIAGGHYAANMAENAIRYTIDDLKKEDITGLRHLYYQRSFIRLAEELNIPIPEEQRSLTVEELEVLRLKISKEIESGAPLQHTSTLWGWNFGFDYAPTSYRLHASHQQIHQQYAMLPETVEAYHKSCNKPCGTIPAYGCGDLIMAVMEEYQARYDSDFFADYRAALLNNHRMDDRKTKNSLIVWQDENVILFVPKAQISQWELQIMTLPEKDGNVIGNIFECDTAQRHSLDMAILLAQQVLAKLGARLVTSIEYPKRIGSTLSQPLLYSFLPRLPESPGAFSEAQLRFINGHYPEDFAQACRLAISNKQ